MSNGIISSPLCLTPAHASPLARFSVPSAASSRLLISWTSAALACTGDYISQRGSMGNRDTGRTNGRCGGIRAAREWFPLHAAPRTGSVTENDSLSPPPSLSLSLPLSLLSRACRAARMRWKNLGRLPWEFPDYSEKSSPLGLVIFTYTSALTNDAHNAGTIPGLTYRYKYPLCYYVAIVPSLPLLFLLLLFLPLFIINHVRDACPENLVTRVKLWSFRRRWREHRTCAKESSNTKLFSVARPVVIGRIIVRSW